MAICQTAPLLHISYKTHFGQNEQRTFVLTFQLTRSFFFFIISPTASLVPVQEQRGCYNASLLCWTRLSSPAEPPVCSHSLWRCSCGSRSGWVWVGENQVAMMHRQWRMVEARTHTRAGGETKMKRDTNVMKQNDVKQHGDTGKRFRRNKALHEKHCLHHQEQTVA